MKILMSARGFPVTMSRYWRMGFESLGHKVMLAGPVDPRGPDIVPWSPPASFPKYVQAPDVLLPHTADVWPLEQVLQMVPEKPDLIIQAGDVFWLSGKAPVPNVIVATDPHAVDVHNRLEHADLLVNMQNYYLENNYKDVTIPKTWIPYGYEPTIHRPLEGQPQNYDVCFIGLPYPQRTEVLTTLASRGLRVLNKLGITFHESNELYNQAPIAFNWSSQLDVPARFFEGMAQKRLMVTNRLPDILKLGFVENEDYVGFGSVQEAVEKVLYWLGRPNDMARVATSGYEKVRPMTWAARAQELLDAVEGL